MAKRMSTAEVTAIVAAERASSLASGEASKLTNDRQDAMDYYNGDMTRALPHAVGRSSAVSTDVADTIEGLMPQLMDIFVGSEEVVRFDPTRPDDIAQAEQETDYVNHVFLQNGGFLTLYSMIKDALLSKMGVVKVSWCEEEYEERQTYFDQDDATYQYLISDSNVEVVAHSERPAIPLSPEEQQEIEENADAPPAAPPAQPGAQPGAQPAQPGAQPPQPGAQLANAPAAPQPPMLPPMPPPMLHDVTIAKKRTRGYAKAEPVPPEEFGISRSARRIKDCGYCFHEVQRTESELIEQGYDREQIKSLPSFPVINRLEETSRDTVDESTLNGDDVNKANRKLLVTEHYCMLDYEGDGKARLYRITTGGDQGVILKRDGNEDIVEWDMIPFAAMTPVIVTHRFYGRSIADLVMDIQRIKTALLRALLDNAYLANNPRTEISESHANENTIDDLLVSRPGGVVRTKQPGGLNTLTTPPIGGHVFPLIEYMDSTREWRTGVTRQGQGIDANVLQNQSATATVQAFNASQARAKLIARIFAETGVKDLFSLLHGVIRKNGSKAETVRLRGKWVQVDPRDWRERNDMTINVGLGSGGRAEKLQNQMLIVSMQKDALANGLTNLVSMENLFNSAKHLVALSGNKAVEEFFTDPKTVPAPQQKPDPKMIELQMKNQLEQTQAQADIATQRDKNATEAQLMQQKFAMESQMARELHDMKMMEMRADLATKLATQAAKPQPGADGAQASGPDPNSVAALLSSLAPPKPKGMKIVRDERGRVSHTVPLD